MCRHTAWLGEQRTLQQLLLDPPCSLLRQSWAPRRQRHGTVNADGFGVGWYDGSRAEPARVRHAVPMWAERTFASIAGVIRSGCVLGAVRSATAGGPGGAEACAPFRLAGDVLLSHNGRLPAAQVAPLVSAAALARIGSTVDSAFLAALVDERLGEGLPAAVAGAVRAAAAVAPDARLNVLATDGRTVVAITWGDTLCWRRDAAGTTVASEPHDDEPGWNDVPDRCLLVATAAGAPTVTPIEGA